MGADSVLVSAAYAAAMANVPKDWSKIFNKQYDGLVLAQQAKYKAFEDVMKKFGETISGMSKESELEQIKFAIEDQAALANVWESIGANPTTVPELATANARKAVEKHAEYYKKGGSLNIDFTNAGQTRFEDIKAELEKIRDKKFRSRKDKKNRMKLLKDLGLMKESAVNNKAAAIKFFDAGSGGENSLINWELTKRTADPDLIALLKHVHLPDAKLKDDWGVKLWYDENNLMVDYFEGRMGIEYNVNHGGNMNSWAALQGNNLPGVKSIKYEDLMGIIKYKAVEQEANIEAIIDGAGTKSAERVKGTNVPIHKEFRDGITGGLETEIYRGIITELESAEVLNDLATRELFGVGRIYENDLENHPGIDNLTYEKILGKDLSEFDLNKDNELDAKERSLISETFLTKTDKKKIREILTNPTKEEELIIAQKEFAQYLTNLAEQNFNKERGRVFPPPSIKPFVFKDNKDYDMQYKYEVSKGKIGITKTAIKGKRLTVAIGKLGSPKEGNLIKGWNGIDYKYENDEWRNVTGGTATNRNQIAIDLGLSEYGYTWADKATVPFGSEYTAKGGGNIMSDWTQEQANVMDKGLGLE